MNVSKTLLEVKVHEGNGYKSLIDFSAWRVAVLRYADRYLPENIKSVQRHDETDEIFVLLQGRCILFVCDDDKGTPDNVYGVDLESMKVYNVKRSVWHSHTLSPDAAVLIVENSDTDDGNSPKSGQDANRQNRVAQLARELWNRL